MKKFILMPMMLALVVMASSVQASPESEALAAKLQAEALWSASVDARADAQTAILSMIDAQEDADYAETYCYVEPYCTWGDNLYTTGYYRAGDAQYAYEEGLTDHGVDFPVLSGGLFDLGRGDGHWDMSQWVDAKEDYDKAIAHFQSSLADFILAKAIYNDAETYFYYAEGNYISGW